MLRKPVRMYVRKNRPFNSHAPSSVSTIIRQEVPPEQIIPPRQVESTSIFDDNLDFDPFDTTFDRLVKDVIEHPVPDDVASTHSYGDSSEDEASERTSVPEKDSLLDELFTSPLPRARKRAVKKVDDNKRPRLGSVESSVTAKRETEKTRRRRVRGKRETDSKDENAEPNAESAETPNYGVKKKKARRNVQVLQKRTVDEKAGTTFLDFCKKSKYHDDGKVLRECRVLLEHLSLPSGTSSGPPNQRNRPRDSRENDGHGEASSMSKSTNSSAREASSDNFEVSENQDERGAGLSENPADSVPEESSIENLASVEADKFVTEESASFSIDGKRKKLSEELSASVSSESPKKNEQPEDSIDFGTTSNNLEHKKLEEKGKRKLVKRRVPSESKENFPKGTLTNVGSSSVDSTDYGVTLENCGSPKRDDKRERKVENPWTIDEKSADSTDFGGSTENMEIRPRKKKKVLIKSVVTLSRLSLPKRVVRRKFSSSTPIFARVTAAGNSLLRLSPIQSKLNEDFEEPSAAEPQSFAPESNVRAVDSVSKKTASSPPMGLDEGGKSATGKGRPGLLSLSPDPEPSGLLFSDEEAPQVSPKLDDRSRDSEASADGSSIDFEKESSNRETSHLIFDKTEESFRFSSSVSSRTSSICTEDTAASPGDSSKDPFMGFSEERAEVPQGESPSDKSRNDDDDWITISGSLNVSRSRSLFETRENFEQLSSGENNSSDEITEFVKANESAKDEILPNDNRVFVQLSRVQIPQDPIDSAKNSIKLRKNDFQQKNQPLEPVVLLSRLTSSKIAKFKKNKHEIDQSLSRTIESLSELNVDEDFTAEESLGQSTSSKETSSDRLRPVNDLEAALTEMESLRVDYSSESPAEESSVHEKSEGVSNLSRDSRNLSSENLEKSGQFSPEKESSNASESKDLSRGENSQDLGKNDESLGDERRDRMQPVVLLSRLNDPYRITRRRKEFRDRGSNLSAISEIEAEKVSTEKKKVERVTRASRMDDIREETSQATTVDVAAENSLNLHEISQESQEICNASLTPNAHDDSAKENKVVYLKPGKSWARSLSILNHVHCQEDLEVQAVGKGRKWRQSVQSILAMQQKGLIQSCVKKNEDSKEFALFTGLRHSTAWIPGSSQPDTSRLFGIASPGRFIRRVSIRVVPDCKSFNNVKDTSFLEAYGIDPSENQQTTTQRNTLKDARKTVDVIPRALSSTKPRDVVLAQCGQKSSLPFDECYPQSYLENCRKIGEGVYGEVFLYEKGKEKNVIKIIPIEGEMKINSERQKKFDEILSEIVIAKELHNLRFADKSTTNCFVEVKKIRCVKGKYPKMLIDLWNIFDCEKNSENDCPSIFEQDQLYIVLELGHGGEDLEAYVFQNAREAHALFMQTALALAVAEESLEFEHRDLHWGNLLISRTEEAQIEFKLDNKSVSVSSRGVKVSVIDFTLSRMSYQGCSIFNDLSIDEDLFVAQGEYQFEIYRLMRKKLENNWQRFEPYTNILWLHYVLDKMITAARYRRKNTKVHKNGLSDLQLLKNEILEYNSAVDFVTNCDKATRLQASRTSVSTAT